MASSTLVKEVNGVETRVILQYYADRVLVLITQLDKVGSLIQASIPPTTAFMSPSDSQRSAQEITLLEPPPSIQLTSLLGSAPDEHTSNLHSLYASQVATLIWTLSSQLNRKSVITGIALKKSSIPQDATKISEQERASFMDIMTIVRDLVTAKS